MKLGVCFAIALGTLSAHAQFYDTSVRARIYAAASAGDLYELQRLKSLGYSLDLKDNNGNTAYCQAVWSQNRTAVATLISAGVDVKPRCLKRIPYVTESRIYAAAHSEDLDQLVEWKREGLNVDVVDPKTGNSALCEAVYNYDCPAIQTLLRAGSQQAQPCMRRVPQEVRSKLQCRPLKINWGIIGYSVLGVGMAGALVAILGSGGDNGTPVCLETQRWNGDRCIDCDTCWKGDVCISKEEMKAEPYYRDETNASCWTVAPPPVTYESEEALKEAAEEIAEQAPYTAGRYLPDINAASAYARGYTGYMIERTSPYGRLVKGDVSPGEAPIHSDKKVTVAIYSSGMAIGQGGARTETTVSTSSSSSSASTSNKKVAVWDWTGVHKGLYDDSQWGDSSVEYTPNSTKTVAFVHAHPDFDKTQSTTVSSSLARDASEVKSNLALNSGGTPYGYNFDYGPCPQDASDSKLYKGKNCYGSAKFLIKKKETDTQEQEFYLAVFYNGTTAQYLVRDKQTGVIKGATETAPASYDAAINEYIDWNNDSKTGVYNVFFAPLQYDTDYSWADNQTDPTPHYTAASLSGVSSVKLVASSGTFLAGIVAAMNKEGGQTYGVAYDAAVLPINKDILGLSSTAVEAMTNNAQVALLDDAYQASQAGVNDALGAFTSQDGSYLSRNVSDVFGGDRFAAYKLFGTKNVVAVVPNGNMQTNPYTFAQPSIQSAVPLLTEFNGATSWTPGKVLPTVASSNPLYHLFLTVGAVNTTTSNDGTTTYYNLAAYSQPCGIAANYCLVAPGGVAATSAAGIYSATDPYYSHSEDMYSYDYSFGTSDAAAVVAGSVALLMGAYPHLTAQQVVEILLSTATYIDINQISDATQKAFYQDNYTEQYDSALKHSYNTVFGYGIVNLDAATKPVGGKNGLWVYKGGKAVGDSSVVVTASSTSLLAPASVSGSLSTALASSLPSTFTAFDAYDRPFEYETAPLFNLQNRRKTKSLNDFKMLMHQRDPVLVEPTENFSMMYREQTQRVSKSSQIPLGLVQMNLKRDKMRYSFFYSQDTTLGKEAYWKRRQVNPFIQMRDAYGLESEYQFNPKWSIEVGWTMGKNGFFDEDDRNFDAPDNKMQAFTSTLVFKPVDKVAFKVATGIMKETGSSLGLVSSGAFNIKGANTHFIGAGMTFSPMDKIRLEAMYYYGQTRTNTEGGLMNMSRLTSDSFALTASYEPDEKNLFGVQFSSPLRVNKGNLNVTLPVGRHPTEDVYYYDTYKVDMKPKARELDLSMYYQGNMTDEISVQSELGVRLNPDHQADAAPDYRGMVGVKWRY